VVSGLRDRVRRFLQKPGTADLSRYTEVLREAAAAEQRIAGLADADLAAAAAGAGGEAEICALSREAARRALGERPYDVQLLGALAMLAGQVAEMATGEGKTLAGAIAAAGYALRGRSVQVMSVNDYLARRDAQWMRGVYGLLGVSVGWIGQASTAGERRRAYAAQVTYAPVSEIGFDVLRDRLVTDPASLVAGDPDVVLIDEADSVLVDEAMVPLVLAGAAEQGNPDRDMADLVRALRRGVDYEIDKDARSVQLTAAGALSAERALGGIELYTAEHADTLTRLNVALHAQALLRRDVEYIVAGGRIHLVNESRGRVARLQRWPDGLHAAVEAKEGLGASETGEILDSLTVQSLVRRYPTVCGMTGTAVAVGEQLREFYGLEIAVIPPHRPCVREDEPDRLYLTARAKEKAVVEQVVASHATGRPVLAGLLGDAGLTCAVLNAKNDAAEAAIIAEAGALGAITVSTQMAGRGTDIRLGGTAGEPGPVAALGGLQVMGTGRHASGRLDRQLRGRAGRQGDPGGSVFFTSLTDALVVRYAPDGAPRPAVQAGGRIRDPGPHATVAHAQRVAEGVGLEIHRNTWRYARPVEAQRRIVLEQRERALHTDAALRALASSCPERVAELSASCDEGALVSAARQLTLWHLDQGWVQHLARIADLQEGIHLRALGRGLDPLNEFCKELARLFAPLLGEAATRSAESFRSAVITADGLDLDAAGLKRPTSTWTYLVQDNPFGTDIDRAIAGIGRLLRKPSRTDS